MKKKILLIVSILMILAFPVKAQDYNEDCTPFVNLGNISAGQTLSARQCMDFGSYYSAYFTARPDHPQAVSLFVKTKGIVDPVVFYGFAYGCVEPFRLNEYNAVMQFSLIANQEKEWSMEISEDYDWNTYREVDYKLICEGTDNHPGMLPPGYRKEETNVAFAQVLNFTKTEGQIITLTVNSVQSFAPAVVLQQLEYGERKTIKREERASGSLSVVLPQEMHGEYCLYIFDGKAMSDQAVTPLFDYTLTCTRDNNYVMFRNPGTASYIRTRSYMDGTGTKTWDKTQYFNGLGFPTQLADERHQTTTLLEYDSQGREVKRWLPVRTPKGRDYWATDMIRRNARSFHNDEYPYTQTLYEASPREVMDKQYKPGYEWQGFRHNRCRVLQPMSNDNKLRCRRFEIVADQLTSSGFHADGALAVSKSTDEDGDTTYQFTDIFGKVILSRQVSEGMNHDTYYVYDERDNLRYVLPPMIAATDSLADDSPEMKKYGYLYRYDSRNRCISKRLPGTEPILYVYDASNHQVFSQDGEQRVRGEWMFSIPDAMGRVVLTGLCTGMTDVSGHFITAEYVGIGGAVQGYDLKSDGQAFTLTAPVILSVNYYDGYDYLSLPGFQGLEYVQDDISIRYGDNTAAGRYRHKGLLTGTRAAVLNTGEFLNSAVYYDQRQRLTQSRKSNHLGGINTESLNYSFTDKVKTREFTHSAAGKTPVKDRYIYTYNEIDLVDVIFYYFDGAYIILQELQYDNLGRLTFLRHYEGNENIDYKYNLNGWLTSIRSEHFNQQLYYGAPSSESVKPRYGGDISSMTWQAGNDTILRNYHFSYDGLKRMRNAFYSESASMNTNTGSFNEQVEGYDKNGNMLGLKRYGQTESNAYGLIDNLTFVLDGNQLKSVEDSVAASAGNNGIEFKDGFKGSVEYKYDSNGNLTEDLNKNIIDIQYNCLNLPSRILFGDGDSISYVYDANGVKLRTTHTVDGVTCVTDYCDKVLYENDTAKVLLTENGYMSLKDKRLHYYVQDHQGNNRVVIDQDNNVEEVNQYYPFGGTFALSSSSVQPYKYNGKELDRKCGLDWYDYGARQYDAALGRFMTTDRFSEKYYSMSPYQYAANNPVNIVDINGDSLSIQANPNGLFDQIRSYLGFDTKYQEQVKADISRLKTDNKEVGDMIEKLEKSVNMHAITMTKKGKKENSSTFDSKKAIEGIPQGSIINYNPYNATDINGRKRAPRVALSHELRHSYDADTGSVTLEKTENGIDIMEVRAVNTENKIRMKTGDSRRKSYGGKEIPKKYLE